MTQNRHFNSTLLFTQSYSLFTIHTPTHTPNGPRLTLTSRDRSRQVFMHPCFLHLVWGRGWLVFQGQANCIPGLLLALGIIHSSALRRAGWMWMVICLCAASWGVGRGFLSLLLSTGCCCPTHRIWAFAGSGVPGWAIWCDCWPAAWLAWTFLLHWGSTDCAQVISSDCAGMAGVCQGQLPSASGSLALLPFSRGLPSSLNRRGHTLASDFQHSWGTGWGLPLSVSRPQGTLLQSLTLIIKYVSWQTPMHRHSHSFFLSLFHTDTHTHAKLYVPLGKSNVFGTTKHLDHESGC